MVYDVRKAELRAAELLFSQPRLSFYRLAHLDARRLCLPIEVIFDSFASYCESTGLGRREIDPSGTLEGITVRFNGKYVILYNEKAIARRRNWTVAHELGHLLLCHEGNAPREEREADAFAAALLTPLPVLRYLEDLRGEPLDADAIYSNFNVSRRAAERRLDELASPRRTLTEVETALMLRLFGGIGSKNKKYRGNDLGESE